jgi:hypothetical protein
MRTVLFKLPDFVKVATKSGWGFWLAMAPDGLNHPVCNGAWLQRAGVSLIVVDGASHRTA